MMCSILYRPEEPPYSVEFPDIPENITSGDTLSEAFANACEALDLHPEPNREMGVEQANIQGSAAESTVNFHRSVSKANQTVVQ